MTTDIAINETISSVLPGDVHTVNETTSSVPPGSTEAMVPLTTISVVI
jgi:hypothetical protein